MPYSKISELPEAASELPTHAKEIWMAAFNAAHEKYPDDEERCFKIAWSAVGEKYKKGDDGKWVEFSGDPIEPEPATMTADTGNGDDISLGDQAVGSAIDNALKRGDITLFTAEIDPEESDLVTKDVKIFEAGDYSTEKGIQVGEPDLDRWITKFEKSKIGYNHDKTRLQFGILQKIWREGKELFGRLGFYPGAIETAKKSNLNGLSVTIPRDKSRLIGVDVAEYPFIKDAIFSFDAVTFSVAEPDHNETEVNHMPDTATAGTQASPDVNMGLAEATRIIEESKAVLASNEFRDFARDNIALAKESREMVVEAAQEMSANNAEFRAQRADMIVDDWKRKGHIARAVQDKVRKLMSYLPTKGAAVKEQDAITFTDDKGAVTEVAHWAQVVKDIIDGNGPVIDLKERMRMGQDSIFSDEDRANAAMMGYTPEQAAAIIAKHEGGIG